MGCNRARARRGRAADHPAQGRHSGDRPPLPARARPLLPLPHVRPPAGRPGPRVPQAGAAARARGGRLGRRRARAARLADGRGHPAARPGFDDLIRRAGGALCLGIGGGGDVVGATATAELARSLGTRAVVGGTTWERRAIDPRPGPRRLRELVGAEPLNEAVALAGPDTRTADGAVFAESRVAGVRGQRTLLVDPSEGPASVGVALADAAARLDGDLVPLVDVGGAVLAHGDEPGLASPLCRAGMLTPAEQHCAT